MIVFDLACICGFEFEGWFQNHADFCRQLESGLLECPVCDSHKITRLLSPVATRHSGSHEKSGIQVQKSPHSETDLAALAQAALRFVGEYVKNNFEDVGSRLSEEALKIHYGVSPARNIRGVATPAEEKTLESEGIELLKVPIPLDQDESN